MTLWELFGTLVDILRGRRRYKESMRQIRTAGQHMEVIQAVIAAYRQGDYEAALQAVAPLRDAKDVSLATSYSFYRGTMLMNLGRLEEAEQSFRRNLAIAQDEKRRALAYSSLGRLLLEMQRYEEAAECFQASLREWPGRGAPHRGLAEVCLRQRREFSEAARWAALAVDEERSRMSPSDSAEVRNTYNINLAENLATLAWAVASESGNRAEVDRIVEEAVSLSSRGDTVTSAAMVHYQSAQAYLAIGEAGESGKHFSEAARIDPKGISGRAARAMTTGAEV